MTTTLHKEACHGELVPPPAQGGLLLQHLYQIVLRCVLCSCPPLTPGSPEHQDADSVANALHAYCRHRLQAKGADEMLDRIVLYLEYTIAIARNAASHLQVQQDGVMFDWPAQHGIGQAGDYMGQVPPPPHSVNEGGNYRFVSPPAWEPPIQMQAPQLWSNGVSGVMCAAGPPFNVNGDFPLSDMYQTVG